MYWAGIRVMRRRRCIEAVIVATAGRRLCGGSAGRIKLLPWTRVSSERPLIFGGGLLGGHLAVRLAEHGYRPTVISRSFNPWLEQQVAAGAAIELLRSEVVLSDQIGEMIDQADRVFFMAGASTPAHADRNTASSVRDSVLTALTVLDLMRDTSTRRIVVASSGGTVYGEPSRLPTREDHALRPISIHGLNSLVTERYVRFFAEQHDLHATVLRYSNVYGPGQTGRRGQGVVAAWFRAFAIGEPLTIFGDLSVTRDFVFATDAAEATVRVGLSDRASDVYNVGSGVGVSLGKVLELVQRASRAAVAIRREQARGVDVSATALDCSRLTSDTGWKPDVSLEHGVLASWNWISDYFGRRDVSGQPGKGSPTRHLH